ncbi:SDR family oxidoreductase [Cryptosporangium sp. NPDC048952]|uniref:SDR family oxidoreductase n=1 Tax=Cryptosporangium sp. NPDC048952 TaxID=3363961 RepID=UPI00371C0547
MKIAVLGGTGLIGSQVVRILTADGHEAVPLAPSTGVDLLTGEGLADGLTGADVVVNLTNSPTFDEASPEFFRVTMENLLAAAEKTGVGHAVILSIVGVDQVPSLDYYRAKTLQEEILAAGPVRYSIVRATQFFEFVDAVLSWTSDATTVRLPATPVQPMASADVAAAVAAVCEGAPLHGIRNVAGPEVFTLDELGRVALAAKGDQRTVVVDDTAGMFAAVSGDAIIPHGDALLATTTFREWLASRA